MEGQAFGGLLRALQQNKHTKRPVIEVESDEESSFEEEVSDVGEELWSYVEAIQQGVFALADRWEFSMLPALHIPELSSSSFSGWLPLPLDDTNHLQTLKSVCEQAPFGRGEETLVDPSYRNTWQLSPDRFVIHNPKWQPAMNGLARRCAERLGHPRPSRVQPHLYKLLLYETGGFFKTHRDTEKEEGMFASMVVQLPCRYEGGQLVVHHAGQTKSFDEMSMGAAYTLYHYAAFYADCPHELLPVTEGHRLCLVYNLVCSPTSSSSVSLPQPPEHLPLIRDIQRVLRVWHRKAMDDEDVPEQLVFMLDHKYSKAGLKSYENLKGRDRTIFDLLREAIATLHGDEEEEDPPFLLDIGMVKLFEAGAASVEFEADTSDYSFVGVSYDLVDLLESDILPEDFFLRLEHDTEEVKYGYMGNEGATAERWYHYGGICLWPVKQKKKHKRARKRVMTDHPIKNQTYFRVVVK
ncbi:Fe2OG dioxygenase domain-containing protein [Balamuthia mandrillaris]